MRIYHYAAYEKTALLRLAGRYGVGEDQIDELLRENVLIDLYATVRGAVRISQPSYSIKKLEPLYMGDQLRTGDVTTAGDSIVEYADYCELVEAGQAAAAAAKLAGIADYNEYDCISTLRLRDWLLQRAAEHGVALLGPQVKDAETTAPVDADPELVATLTCDFVDLARAERTAEQQARAVLAASLGYHQREDKPFWWAHFDRLQNPVEQWAETSGVLIVESAEVIDDWAKSGRQQTPRRRVRIAGTVGGGVDVPKGVFAVYDPTDLPNGAQTQPGYRATNNASVRFREPNAPGIVEIEEVNAADVDGGMALPIALTPNDVLHSHAPHCDRRDCDGCATEPSGSPPSLVCSAVTLRDSRAVARFQAAAGRRLSRRSPRSSVIWTIRTWQSRAHPVRARRMRARAW